MRPPCSCQAKLGRCDAAACDYCVKGAAYDVTQCRVCWLWHNEVAFRLAWGGAAGTLQIMKNFLAASANHLAAGLSTVDDDVHRSRLEACFGCEAYREATGKCDICGCAVHTKARWATQDCPVGKWVASPRGVKEGSEGV